MSKSLGLSLQPIIFRNPNLWVVCIVNGFNRLPEVGLGDQTLVYVCTLWLTYDLVIRTNPLPKRRVSLLAVSLQQPQLYFKPHTTRYRFVPKISPELDHVDSKSSLAKNRASCQIAFGKPSTKHYLGAAARH